MNTKNNNSTKINNVSDIANISLIIKRTETFQTQEFIIKAFASSNIGKVKEVQFVKKQNDNGEYNGATVIFERWNMNIYVQKLFDDINSSPTKTAKFYFDRSRYWLISINKQKLIGCDENIKVDSKLPNKDRIAQLESIINSLTSQIYYMQSKQEQTECNLMDYERNHIQHHLINTELHSQLEQKDLENKFENEKLKKELEQLREKNNALQSRLTSMAIDFARKCKVCDDLRQEINDNNNIVAYIETQARDMSTMLKNVLDTDPIKPQINNYIKEYIY